MNAEYVHGFLGRVTAAAVNNGEMRLENEDVYGTCGWWWMPPDAAHCANKSL